MNATTPPPSGGAEPGQVSGAPRRPAWEYVAFAAMGLLILVAIGWACLGLWEQSEVPAGP